MSDELENKKPEQEVLEGQETVVEAAETEGAAAEGTHEEKVEEPEQEQKEEETEEVKEQEPKEDEPKAAEPEVEEPAKPQEEVEETIERPEENEEEKSTEGEENVEEPKGDEPTKEPERTEDIELVKKELAEKEAELAEEKAIKAYEDDVREANRQLDEFLQGLGNAMVQEFAKYGIDPDTNLDELKKKDPAKAQVAENIIRQAQNAKATAMANVQNNLNDRLTDVIFDKASRLFDKFQMTTEEATIAAETFINILEEAGIKDMGADLAAKVELAVARAKMIAPKVETVVEQVEEIVEDVKDAVKDVKDEVADKKEKAEEKEDKAVESEKNKEAENKPKEEEVQQQESVIEKPDLEEFKEGAVVSNQEANGAVTVDNVMQKMAELPFKERTAFYKEHFDLIQQAAKNETIKRAGKNKV